MKPHALKPIRLLIVDDIEDIRLGIRDILDQVSGLEIVGEAASVAAAVAEADRLSPDFVLLDVQLPDGKGFEACRHILAERPETRVLVLTSHADESFVQEA